MAENERNESTISVNIAQLITSIFFVLMGGAIFISALGSGKLLEVILGISAGLGMLAWGIWLIVDWLREKRLLSWKSIGVFAIVVIMLVGVISCALSPSGIGGDGKSSCKNCGRNSVYALGFCKSCYKSFHDFTYDNDE